jgi:hypothetical protein
MRRALGGTALVTGSQGGTHDSAGMDTNDPRLESRALASPCRPLPVALGVIATCLFTAPRVLVVDVASQVLVSISLAWRVPPRGTITSAGTARPMRGNGG